MKAISQLWDRIVGESIADIPFFIALIFVAAIMSISWWLLLRRDPTLGAERRIPRQIAMMGLWIAAVIILVVTLPVSDSTRGGLLSLLGVVLSAAIALASTNFIRNAIAGLILRSSGGFRPGDFIRVGDHFGRVTERGLIQTEIQTEDRDLTTLPNLYLVENPVRVVRPSGTIVSAMVSLGYDVSRRQIEERLIEAAAAADLSDAFVQIADLGDFAVSYRVAGFLPNVSHLLTARSNLRKRMLDALHGAGIEIVSPTFMNQRVLDGRIRVIPDGPSPGEVHEETMSPTPEGVIFDKAEAAERVHELETTLEEARQELASIEEGGGGDGPSRTDELGRRIASLEARLEEARNGHEER